MNYQELLDEEVRVKVLLATNKHPLTQKQNRKYLAKIQKEIIDYLKFKEVRA